MNRGADGQDRLRRRVRRVAVLGATVAAGCCGAVAPVAHAAVRTSGRGAHTPVRVSGAQAAVRKSGRGPKTAVRYEALWGFVLQKTTWTSDSASDNGCFTGSFADSGSTRLFLSVKDHSVVRAVRSPDASQGMVLSGLTFDGPIEQHGVFSTDWTPDQSPPSPACGQPTGPFYATPSTADCGRQDITGENSNLQLTVPIGRSPALPPALVGSFYVHDPYRACPSDDPVDAVTPLFTRAKQSVSAFRRRRTITLVGARAQRSSGGMYYRGLDHHDGDSLTVIHWEIRLRRL